MTARLTSPDGSRSTTPSQLETTGTSTRFFGTFDVPGTWKLVLQTADGSATRSIEVGPPDPNRPPRPAITSVLPSGLVIGDAEQILTLQGTGFQSGLSAEFLASEGGNRVAGRIVSVTPTSVQVGVALVRSGLWNVSVRNPDYLQSNGALISVARAPGPDPVPTLNPGPVAVTTSLAEQTVTITGSGFRELSHAIITPPPADLDVPESGPVGYYVNSTTFKLVGRFARPGTWRVYVETVSLRSNTIDVVVSQPNSAPPVIAGLVAQPIISSSSQIVRVQGTGFQPGLRVLVVGDDSARVAKYSPDVDSLSSTAFRLNAFLYANGRLQVQNPDGRVSNIYRFTRQTPPPFFGAVSSQQPILVSATAQTIRTFVSFVQPGVTLSLTSPTGASRPVSNVVVTQQSATLAILAFTAVLDVAGIWRMRLTNPDGTRSGESGIYVYAAPAPTITAILPEGIRADHASQLVTVQGTGFAADMSVEVRSIGIPILPGTSFTGTDLMNVTPSSFQIRPTLFLGNKSWVVTVRGADGQSAERNIFVTGTVAPPTVSAIDPQAPTKGTSRVFTVRGANFHPGLDVTVRAPDGTARNYTSAVNIALTSFQLFLGFDQSGAWSITVRNADGQSSSPLTFTVP
ncbi:MAG TPA: hypothetical protein VIP11_23445 [Gemmatimonadaceae bacterium]